jgi:DNA-binding MarR family transcriptional regulator
MIDFKRPRAAYPESVESRSASPGIPVQPTPSALARRFQQICTTVVADALAEESLTPTEYAVLAYLYVQPDIDQNGLAARLGIDRASTSNLLDYLEKFGLVDRRVNGNDRRARLLRLTLRGRKLRERLHPVGRAAEARIVAPLKPDERETLINLLARLIAANEAYARPGAGRRKPRSTKPLSKQS